MFDKYWLQTGVHHPIARKAPPAPQELTYLIRYFEVANRGRQLTPGGWMAIPASEYQAVEHLLHVRFTRWELNALFRLDDVWRQVMMEESHSFDDEG